MSDFWDIAPKQPQEWITQPELDGLGDVVDNTEDPAMTSIIIPVCNNNYPLWHYTGNCATFGS